MEGWKSVSTMFCIIRYIAIFFSFFLISIFHFSWHAKNIIHRDEWIALHSRLNGLKRHASRQMAILVCLPCTYRSYKQKHLKNVTIFPSTKNTSFISGAQNSPLKKLIAPFSQINVNFIPDSLQRTLYYQLLETKKTAHFPLKFLNRTVHKIINPRLQIPRIKKTTPLIFEPTHNQLFRNNETILVPGDIVSFTLKREQKKNGADRGD